MTTTPRTPTTRIIDVWSDAEVDALTAHNLSEILAHSLTEAERHFLRRSNHSLLRHFIGSLSEPQQALLDWLIFCALLGHVCEDGHSPVDLVDDGAQPHRLQKVDWSAIEELPAIIASERHHEALQVSTTFHGKEHGYESEAE